MPLDTLIEAAADKLASHFIGRMFRAIFYWPGCWVLRALSMGRYPPHRSVRHNETAVAVFAFVLLLIAVTAFYS